MGEMLSLLHINTLHHNMLTVTNNGMMFCRASHDRLGAQSAEIALWGSQIWLRDWSWGQQT